MKTLPQRAVACLTCGTDVPYRTTRPTFCSACYRARRNARRAGLDTSDPINANGFRTGHSPWNRGLTIEDDRVAGYAAKLRILERDDRPPRSVDSVWCGVTSIRPSRPVGPRIPRCRLCHTSRDVAWHHLDLNPDNVRRSNRMQLCASCRQAVLRLVGRDENLLAKLLRPSQRAVSRAA